MLLWDGWATVGMRIVLDHRIHRHMARPNKTSASVNQGANVDRHADSVTPTLKRIPSGQYREIGFKPLASRGVHRLCVGTVIIHKSSYTGS